VAASPTQLMETHRGNMAGPSRAYPLYRLAWSVLDWVYPPECACCGKPGTRWCTECRDKVQVIRERVCPICGSPQSTMQICARCRREPPCFQCLRSWAIFADPFRKVIHRLKYSRDTPLGDCLAAAMAPTLRALDWPIDLVTPIPLGRKRQFERGYNQAGMIARPLALALGLRYAPKTVARWRDTRSQVGLAGAQRRENVRGAFRARGQQVRGQTVLIIDDVATTGSTLSSAAEALLAAGAKQVYAFTAARA
jgi:ComF family protein